ncbi:hypothetical protein [Thalassotalea ganghwensis]
MNYLKFSVSFTTWVFIVLANVAGCSSHQDLVADKHVKAVSKWHELAAFSKVKQIKLPFKITTELNASVRQGQNELAFTKIKLANTESNKEIDLLNPSFRNKYICLVQCMGLTEYVRINNSTLLDTYFSIYEFSLFDFYGRLYKLNRQVNRLKSIAQDDFSTYIDWLIKTEYQSDDLKSFITYLEKKLTLESYYQFRNNPEDYYAKLFSENTDSLWDETEEDYSPEIALWDLTDEIAPLNGENTSITQLQETFAELQKQPLDIGNIVCHFDNNTLGVVKAISGKRAKVKFMGSYQQFYDGQYLPAPSGYIFSNSKDFTMIKIEDIQYVNLSEIAKCDLSLITQ